MSGMLPVHFSALSVVSETAISDVDHDRIRLVKRNTIRCLHFTVVVLEQLLFATTFVTAIPLKLSLGSSRNLNKIPPLQM